MITVTILTKNSADTLGKTLEGVQRFPEVIVMDTGSIDDTKEIARSFANVRLIEEKFMGFGKTHNRASSLASHKWILSIDSDEVLSAELAEEILSLSLENGTVYSLNRHNYFNDKWMKCCSGWYPDPVIRLYNREVTAFTDDEVHEKVLADQLRVIALKGKLSHTPYRSIESFLQKMQLYSTLFAEQNAGKNSSLGKALVHGCTAFLRSYIFKRGFLGGKEGLIISLYNAHATYYKYLKLAFRNKTL